MYLERLIRSKDNLSTKKQGQGIYICQASIEICSQEYNRIISAEMINVSFFVQHNITRKPPYATMFEIKEK